MNKHLTAANDKLLIGFLSAAMLLTACSSTGQYHTATDGAPISLPQNLDAIADAVPKAEALSRYGNPDSYVVFGKRYFVKSSSEGYEDTGTASWYGTHFHGKRTSSGEPYDMFAMSAAHKTLPLPSYARITHLENQRSVIVKINDRGPFHDDRLIDLSYTAAHKLGMLEKGTAPVRIEAITMTAASTDSPTEPHTASLPLPTVIPFNTSDKEIAAANNNILLQVGAFSSAKRAKAIATQVEKIGALQVTVDDDNAQEALYKVRVKELHASRTVSELSSLISEVTHSLPFVLQ